MEDKDILALIAAKLSIRISRFDSHYLEIDLILGGVIIDTTTVNTPES